MKTSVALKQQNHSERGQRYVHVCRPAVGIRDYGESYPMTDGLACGPDFIITTRENKQNKQNKQAKFEVFIKIYADKNTEITTTYLEIKCQLDATDDLYCRSYCLLNMFRAPLCPSSGAREYYTSGC